MSISDRKHVPMVQKAAYRRHYIVDSLVIGAVFTEPAGAGLHRPGARADGAVTAPGLFSW